MRNKGFSLIELIIAIAIISILATTGIVSFSRRAERNALIEMKTQIPTFVENAAQRSLEKGEAYSLDFNFNSEIITLSDGGGNIDDLDLETVLQYAYIDASNTPKNTLPLSTTTTGNISTSAGIYIFDRDGEALYKVELESGLPTDYVGIRTFEPSVTMSVGELTYDTALTGSALTVTNSDNWTED